MPVSSTPTIWRAGSSFIALSTSTSADGCQGWAGFSGRGWIASRLQAASAGALGQLEGVVIIGVSTGGPRTLEDILLRRLRIALELPDGGAAIAPQVAAVAAPVLGWDGDAASDQVAQYLAQKDRHFAWKDGGHGGDSA